MRAIAAIGLALTMFTLSACNAHFSTSAGNEELNGEAEEAYRELVAGNDDALVGRLSSDNDPAVARRQLDMLRDLAGSANPPEPEVTGSRSSTTTNGRFYEVAQTYTYDDRVVTVQTVFIQEDGEWRVQGFNLNTNLTRAPEAEVDPSQAGKPIAVVEG